MKEQYESFCWDVPPFQEAIRSYLQTVNVTQFTSNIILNLLYDLTYHSASVAAILNIMRNSSVDPSRAPWFGIVEECIMPRWGDASSNPFPFMQERKVATLVA